MRIYTKATAPQGPANPKKDRPQCKKGTKKTLESCLGAAWQPIRAVCYVYLHERRMETGRNKERKERIKILLDTFIRFYTIL